MQDLEKMAKEKVLQEIMDLMDSNMTGDLKSKSPKMMAVQVETKKPEDESAGLDQVKSALMDPDHDGDDDSKEMAAGSHETPQDDDDIERLKELYAKLK
jgi:hypothetical protein